MKKFIPILIVMPVFLLSSCAIISGIFKAGVWVGILITLFVFGIIIWLLTKSRKS
jgi:hypothetical protein